MRDSHRRVFEMISCDGRFEDNVKDINIVEIPPKLEFSHQQIVQSASTTDTVKLSKEDTMNGLAVSLPETFDTLQSLFSVAEHVDTTFSDNG